MTEECPKCGRRLGLTSVEIAKVGNLLQCANRFGCGVVLMVTKAGPSPADFELRLATEEEKRAWIESREKGISTMGATVNLRVGGASQPEPENNQLVGTAVLPFADDEGTLPQLLSSSGRFFRLVRGAAGSNPAEYAEVTPVHVQITPP